MTQSNFPKRLKLLMSQLNINQKKLSQITGIPEGSLSRYAAGTVIPTTTVVIKIADNTEVDVGWLLGFGPDNAIERMD